MNDEVRVGPGAPTQQDRRAWRIGFGTLALSLGAAGMAVQYVAGTLGPILVTELALSRTQLGAIPSVLFAVAAVCSLAVGRAVDRLGGRASVYATLGLATLAVAAIAGAWGYAALVLAAAVGGVAAAAANPVTNLLVTRHVRRGAGLFLGLKQAGAQLYAFLCGAALPAIALTVGWRISALAATFPPLASVVMVRRIVPSEPIGTPTAGNGDGLRGEGLLPIWTYALVMGAGQGPVVTYLPLYGFEAIGFDAVSAGAVVGAAGLAGVAGRVTWGALATRFRSHRSLLVWLALTATVSVTLVASATWLGPGALWTGAVLFGSSSGWMTAVMLAVVQLGSTTSPGRRSSQIMVPAYLGVMISALSFGALVDLTGSYALAWGMLAALLAVGSLLVLPARRLAARPR